ncbi:MAG TPA: VOC family protein [Acidimicrobiales bacterium]|nr:VOC family protein [Acidimicrobiales bacterium]
MGVRIEIGIDTVMPERLAPFWAEALGYEIGDMDQAGTYLDLVPPESGMPVVYLQRVPEPKTVKNRLHLDLLTADSEETIGRLTSLGATRVGTPMSGSEGGWWQVMTDPEGNEFCICHVE